MRRCVVCDRRIWAILSILARTLSDGRWVCGRWHYTVVTEYEAADLSNVFR